MVHPIARSDRKLWASEAGSLDVVDVGCWDVVAIVLSSSSLSSCVTSVKEGYRLVTYGRSSVCVDRSFLWTLYPAYYSVGLVVY